MKQATISSAPVDLFTTTASTRVLHIIKSLGRGGAEKLLVETLKQHDHRRFDMHFVYFLPWKNQLASELEENGGTVTCLPARSSFGIFLTLFRLIAYIRRNEIDIIHAHMPVAGIIARIAGIITGTPVVYTEHNIWERYHKLTRFINKLTYRFQNKVVAVSAQVGLSIKNNYRRTRPAVQIVRNGVDTSFFSRDQFPLKNVRTELSIPEDVFVIGVTCVFRAQKRLETWIEIAAKLHRSFPELRFIVVGDGVLREKIFKKAAELDTSSYLHFTGLQTDIRPYLAAMDFYMMTSEFEGLPVALLEAMSMHCVPACTQAGGTGEIVKDGINGVMVPIHSPHQLYEKLSAVLTDASAVEKMKNEARDTVLSRFGIDRMVRKLEDIYDSLVNKRKSS